MAQYIDKILSFINTLEAKEMGPEKNNPHASQIDTDVCWDDGNF